LPLARRKLRQLASLPHEGIRALPLAADPAAAAQPTPQEP
jgi:hypothetical protein